MRAANVILIALLAVGCHRDRDPDAFLDGKYHAPKPEGAPIDVFYSDAKPPRPYTPIRIIRMEGRKDAGSITKEARNEAREFGGDGVYFSGIRGSSSEGHFGVPLVSSGGTESRDIVEAIVFVYDH